MPLGCGPAVLKGTIAFSESESLSRMREAASPISSAAPSPARFRHSSSWALMARICITRSLVSSYLSRMRSWRASCSSSSAWVAFERGSTRTSREAVRDSPPAVSLTVYAPGAARGAITAEPKGLAPPASSGRSSEVLWRRSHQARFRPALALSLSAPSAQVDRRLTTVPLASSTSIATSHSVASSR